MMNAVASRDGGMAFLLALAGCEPSPKGVVERHRPVATGHLDNIAAAVEQVRQRPPLANDTLTCGHAIRFAWGGDEEGVSNAHVLAVSDYESRKDFRGLSEVWTLDRDGWWLRPRIALHVDPAALKGFSGDGLKTMFAQFARVKYFLVLREESVTQPKVIYHDATSKYSGTSFAKGTVRGEAHLFRLEDRQYFGGIRFAAASPDNRWRPFFGDPSSRSVEQIEQDLLGDLRSEARTAALRELRQRAPQVTVPWLDG